MLPDIRAGLAANLKVVYGTDFDIRQYIEQPHPPTIEMYVADDDAVTYHDAMQGGAVTLRMVVRALLGFTTTRATQMLLDKLLDDTGPLSLPAAIEADKQLTSRMDPETGTVTTGYDPACDDLIVESASGHTTFDVQGVEYIGCSWAVQILV